MDIQAEPNIVAADRLKDALIVAFSDGRVAAFSSKLLYATIGAAQELPQENEEESLVGYVGAGRTSQGL